VNGGERWADEQTGAGAFAGTVDVGGDAAAAAPQAVVALGRLRRRRRQRQRVAIGRSIVREPSIFLFDEPLSNLDAELRLQMRVEISTLHATLGNTMIYVTHDQVEAMTMADRIVILRAGRVEQIGKPLDLFNHPVNRFVAGFIGAPQMNFLAAEATAHGVRLTDGTELHLDLDAAPGHPVTIGIRPESVPVSLDGAGDLTATVTTFEQLGAITYIYTTLPGGETLTVQHMSQLPLKRGQKIGVSLPPEVLHVFDTQTGAALGRRK
jgi:ABC-type sugar transport system ATPase subunit